MGWSFWSLAAVLLPVGAMALGSTGRSDESLVLTVSRLARIGRSFSPSFSPDGATIAFVSDLSGIPQIWTVPAGGGWPTLVTSGDDPVESVAWSPRGNWLAYLVAPGGGVNAQVHVVRPDGSGARRLTPGGRETCDLSDWTPDGERLAMNSNARDPATIEACLADPVSGKIEPVCRSRGIETLEGVDRGRSRALLNRMVRRGDNDLYLVDLKTRRETLLTPHRGHGTFTGRLSPDGRTVYLSSNADRDLLAFARIDLSREGAPGRIDPISSRPDAELDWFEIDPQGRTAALLWNVAGRSELEFVTLPSGRVTRGPALPHEVARAPRFSRDGRQLALTVYGAAAPPDVWILDCGTLRFRQVTHSPHAGVDLSTLVRPDLVQIEAHDRLGLSGWLYRVPGKAGPTPFVISFHGGPEGQERPTFRADYQALVGRGIGVLAPNVRGSTGFGKRFLSLDDGPLRVDAIRDIESCVDHLVEARLARPGHIGITGGSYGGYMTMAGVTEYPDLFAAGANLFGIVNFFSFFEHTEPWMAAVSTEEYGDPKTQRELLERLSPIRKLDRIKAALMVQHGANDTNVPVIEAEQIVQNLKKRNVPVEYILFPDEGHGWRKIQNRVRSTTALVQFFTDHLLSRGPR